MKYNEIKGNLITLAKQGKFDVIAHGCNCFCAMASGLAPQMAEAFDCNDKYIYKLENPDTSGNIDKLGRIEYKSWNINGYPFTLSCDLEDELVVVNAYTQYKPGANLDYIALRLCLKKLNHQFKGKHIGLPQIGCGIAGGDWDVVKYLIQLELTDCDVTVVIYNE